RLGSLVRGFSLFSPCVLDGVRRPPTCCGRFYESPVRSLATSQMDAAPDSGSIIKNAIWCTYRPVELGLPLSQALYVRKDAGTQRYNVGTDTPKLCATSRGRDRCENPRTRSHACLRRILKLSVLYCPFLRLPHSCHMDKPERWTTHSQMSSPGRRKRAMF